MFCLNENIPRNRDVLAVFIYLSTGPETVAGGSDVGRSQDVKGVEEKPQIFTLPQSAREGVHCRFFLTVAHRFIRGRKKRALSYSDANE